MVRRAHVERAAEDVGEAQDVVDLVRIVGAAGGDDRVGAHGAHLLRRDLRVGIGHGEDDRLGRHRPDHLLRSTAPLADRPKNTSAPSIASASVRALVVTACADFHWFMPFGAALVDHALGVAQDDVVVRQAHALSSSTQAIDGGAGAVDHHLDVFDVAAGQVQRVDQAGGGDDRGAVLVVMEDRDVHQLAQALLDDEAFRRLDVFQVDAAEGRAEEAHAVDELVDVLGVDLEVDAIDVGEALEQDGLAFHHRLRGQRAEIAQAQHGGAVGDHRDEIALGRVVVGQRRDSWRCAGRARRRRANRPGTGRAAWSAAWSGDLELARRPSEWKRRASSSVTCALSFGMSSVSLGANGASASRVGRSCPGMLRDSAAHASKHGQLLHLRGK